MQLGEQLVALHVWHHDVRDHHVGGAALEGGQRLAPVAADFDFARRVAERLLEQTLVNRLVLNDQNSMHTEIPSPVSQQEQLSDRWLATSESGNLFHKRLYLGADVRRCSGDSRQRRIFAAAGAKA